jgi:hypothetical protein
MTTRRPQRPISEKGVYHKPVKQSWFDKMNANGDLSNIILQVVLAPFALPYFWIKRFFK